jgi:hypothetical protein
MRGARRDAAREDPRAGAPLRRATAAAASWPSLGGRRSGREAALSARGKAASASAAAAAAGHAPAGRWEVDSAAPAVSSDANAAYITSARALKVAALINAIYRKRDMRPYGGHSMISSGRRSLRGAITRVHEITENFLFLSHTKSRICILLTPAPKSARARNRGIGSIHPPNPDGMS